MEAKKDLLSPSPVGRPDTQATERLEEQANSFTNKQIVWVTCGINHERNPRPRVYWCPGQYGGMGLLVWIFPRSQSQSV